MAGNQDNLRQSATADTICMNFDRSDQVKSQLEMLNSTGSKEDSIVKSIIRAPNRSFRLVPFSKANMISIEDILQSGPDFVHEGKFLLCRSIMPAAKSDTLTIVVDDPDGRRCARVSLVNFPATIRPGTILAIMHPWNDPISLAIRVENPVHVRVVDGDEDIVQGIQWGASLPEESGISDQKPIDDPSRRGDVYFVDKNYPKAVEAYSKAIQIQPENAVLYSNRAAAYLRMEKSEEAFQDTELGLKLQPSNTKLLFRKAKALLQLKRYEEAFSFLEKVNVELKGAAMKVKEFANLVKASKRMVEESKGKYDIMAMIEETKRSPLLENHADYHATDKFEIKEIPGKGRGLVAKEKIKAGTLLIASKAFVFAEVSEGSISIDWSTKDMESVTFTPMVQKATEKLMNNPKLGDQFYKLYAGKELGYLEKADLLNPVDIDRICGISRCNTLMDENRPIDDTKFQLGADQCGIGVWLSGAMINHGCVDMNTFHFIVGNFLFVRTVKDIDEGDEILIGYVSSQLSFDERTARLSQYQFECSCPLCLADRADTKEVKDRCAIIRKYLKDGEKTVPYLRRVMNEAEDLRDDLSLNILYDQAKWELGSAMLKMALRCTTKQEALRLLNEVFDKQTKSVFDKEVKSVNDKEDKSGDIYWAYLLAKEMVLFTRLEWKLSSKWTGKVHTLGALLYGDGKICNKLKFGPVDVVFLS